MADKVNDVNIEIGVRISVVVEFCVENIISVCLKHKGKEFRGVLLECNTGLYPGGVPYTRHSSPLYPVGHKEGPDTSQRNGSLCLKSHPEQHQVPNVDGQRMDIPAMAQRFSYNSDPFLTHPRLSPEVTVVEMKAVGPRKRTIRDIRLRPRQTLCSNCKCAIHESKKNRNTISVKKESVEDSNERTLRTRTSERSCSSTLQSGQRKRRCPSSSPMVLLEDITRKSSKLIPFKNAKPGSENTPKNGQRQNHDKLVNGNSIIGSVNGLPCKSKDNNTKLSFENSVVTNSHSHIEAVDFEASAPLLKVRKSKSLGDDFTTKPTPAIKISIGDGDVLKIPPRLPETESFASNNTSAPKNKLTDTKESQIHRKAKKSGRKSREKERYRSVDSVSADSVGPNNDPAVNKPQKKHKKKHRHRHQTQNNYEVTEKTCLPLEPTEPVEAIEPIESIGPVEVKEKPAQQLPTKIKVGDVFIDVVNISESESDRETCNGDPMKDENHYENHENASPNFDNLSSDRPRLVYTLKQDQGLSRVATTPQSFSPEQSPRYLVKTSPSIMPLTNSPHRRKNASPGRVVSASPNVHFTNSPSCLLKDYPLRSKTSCTLPGQPSDLLSLAEHNGIHPSEDSQSHSSGLDSHASDSSDDSGEEQQSDDIFSGAATLNHEPEDKGSIKPLMMKIQTQNVTGCLIEDGREIHVGDIVWGKIQGFPWWPGRVSGITVTQRDNDVVITQLANVAWFGSNTMSHVHCSDLFPFLQDFKIRYNKKKKGQYRQAIKQATLAARSLHAESTEEIMDFLD